MSDWLLIVATVFTAIATCVIAYASVCVWRVYEKMAGQIDRQIDLTREMFLSSHAPALAVSLEECQYAATGEQLVGRIVLRNHGTVAARDIDLRIAFDGSNTGKSIKYVAIQPDTELTYPFTLPLTTERYKNSHTQGNRVSYYSNGSYRGLEGTAYTINERAELYPELNKFVLYWTE